MNAEQFKKLVNSLDVGKKLPDSIYFHKETFSDVIISKLQIDIASRSMSTLQLSAQIVVPGTGSRST